MAKGRRPRQGEARAGAPRTPRPRRDLKSLVEPGAHWRHKIVITAARLDLFSLLAQGPQDAAAVAAHYRGDARAFEVFLNALAGIGLLKKRQGRFSNSAFAGRRLAHGAPGYQGDQLVVDDMFWDTWGRLEETLRSGKPALPESIFRANPEAARRLLLGLHRDAMLIAPALARRLPLRACATLLDVGGGAGSYAIAFCQRYPRLRATVLDLPTVTPITRSTVGSYGLSDRITVADGDFTAGPPPQRFDAVFISNILHSHSPEENQRIVANAWACLAPGGCIIVRDLLMGRAVTSPEFGAVFAVNMLLHTRGGRCYSLQEIAAWLAAAGFTGLRHIEPHAVVVARKTSPSQRQGRTHAPER